MNFLFDSLTECVQFDKNINAKEKIMPYHHDNSMRKILDPFRLLFLQIQHHLLALSF